VGRNGEEKMRMLKEEDWHPNSNLKNTQGSIKFITKKDFDVLVYDQKRALVFGNLIGELANRVDLADIPWTDKGEIDIVEFVRIFKVGTMK